MRGKEISRIKSSGQCVDYILDLLGDKEKKKIVRLLVADGVDNFVPFTEDKRAFASNVARSLDFQTRSNPEVKMPIAHWEFSWEKGEQIDDEKMLLAIELWRRQMGYNHTQCIVVRHDETGTPHAHAIINQVDYLGRRILRTNLFRKSASVISDINHSLSFMRGDDICISQAKEDRDPRERARRACCQAVFSALCELGDETIYHMKKFCVEVYKQSLAAHTGFVCNASVQEIEYLGIPVKKIKYIVRERKGTTKKNRFHFYDRRLDDKFGYQEIVETLSCRDDLNNVRTSTEAAEEEYRKRKKELSGKIADDAKKMYAELAYALRDIREDEARLKARLSNKDLRTYLTMLHYQNLLDCSRNLKKILVRKEEFKEERVVRFKHHTPQKNNNQKENKYHNQNINEIKKGRHI